MDEGGEEWLMSSGGFKLEIEHKQNGRSCLRYGGT